MASHSKGKKPVPPRDVLRRKALRRSYLNGIAERVKAKLLKKNKKSQPPERRLLTLEGIPASDDLFRVVVSFL